NQGKRLLGTWGGDSDPDRDFPKYCEMILSGVLDPSPMITKIYALENINEALDDLEAGKVVRPMICMKP
ncbi:MAG TPA: alcohol dehydrogenase, partial [bacterium]|nr:alcohol dehydrogenase [bacterium]